METSGFRHQCFLYDGSPSQHIPMIAKVIKAKLEARHSCCYFHSPRMVAELAAHLAEAGVDVARETAKNTLVLSSSLSHLSKDQTFDVERMIAFLEDALKQALRDGYVGLWATGDVAWEFGPKGDFGQLAAYEKRLEDFLCAHAEVSGICQYHAGALPPHAMRTGYEMHPAHFIDATHSRLNPDFGAANRVDARIDEFDLSLPGDIHKRASDWANSQGITLHEFIHRAIAERLQRADQKRKN
jgi:hypothetical protein